MGAAMSDEDDTAIRLGIRVSRLRGARLEPGDAQSATALARVLASVEPLAEENERLRHMVAQQRSQSPQGPKKMPTVDAFFTRDRSGQLKAPVRFVPLDGSDEVTVNLDAPKCEIKYDYDKLGRIKSPVRFIPLPEA